MAETLTFGRTAYSDYVNHMIRYYIICPDSFEVRNDPDMTTEERHQQTISFTNWQAVQAVFSDLEPEYARFLTDVFRRRTLKVHEAVRVCCRVHGMTEGEAWKLICRVSERIARARGLI